MDELTKKLDAIGLEEKATTRFRAYRDELVRQLGRGPPGPLLHREYRVVPS